MIIASDNLARNTGIRLGVVFAALVLGDTVRSRRELREARRERDLRITQEREQENLRRIADERLRIARDLHDTVAHALVAINVRAGVAAHLHASHDSDDALRDIMAVSAEALNDLRSTLSLLRQADDPAPTAPTLDLGSLTQLLDRARAAGIDADAKVELNGHAIPLAVEQASFRIVQEALTNVMRHAAASHALVSVHVNGDTLDIDVSDDGTAAAPRSPATDGHGLRGMSERAAALGASVGRSGRARRLARSRAPPARVREAMIRVLLAEDQAIVRAGFRALLDAEPTSRSPVKLRTDARPSRSPASFAPTSC
jgi:Signal transduction histidine kinase